VITQPDTEGTLDESDIIPININVGTTIPQASTSTQEQISVDATPTNGTDYSSIIL
jgi:hypothetical protein